MTTPSPKIIVYLSKLKRALKALPTSERKDILAETRSHLLERLEQGEPALDAAFEAMGLPETYARAFLEDFKADAPVRKSGPVMFWQTLLTVRSGLLGIIASGVFFGLFYQTLAIAAMAPIDLIKPEIVGLWMGKHDNGLPYLFFGISPYFAEQGAHEVLGYWVIPIALLIAAALYKVTTRLLHIYLVFHHSRQKK